MQRHRFFALPSQIAPPRILLDAEESHHLAKVLRLEEGDPVFVFDGEGREYECEVETAERKESRLRILREWIDPVESPLELTLAQALVKSDKFDWIVQKGTELGVTRIVPLITEHCEIKKAEERAEQKLSRWRRISMEALKQCGRRRLVEIAEPVHFSELAKAQQAANNLFFSERNGKPFEEIARRVDLRQPFNLFIGPEGGWSEREKRKAEEHGFHSVTLGSRILRTETAAVVAMTLAQHLAGDLR